MSSDHHKNVNYYNIHEDPSPYMNFTDYFHGNSMDYNSLSKPLNLMSSSPYEAFSSSVEGDTAKSSIVNEAGEDRGGVANETPPTPNSSASFSSSEAAGGDGTKKELHETKEGDVDGVDSSNKRNKGKKKAERKQREPRFAFMTKSEVDHLEDGYRWRKYGQKAVKNSPYPRSYYRCTTQKCSVKKRVERSYQDPSTVITTYEGQHNHPTPTTLRGYVNVAAMFPHSIPTPPSMSMANGASSFAHQEFLMQMASITDHQANNNSLDSMYQQHFHQHHYQVFGDNGLAQDVVPGSMFPNYQP